MAEEFTIKSETLEDKINQLLPSQGGYATGLDLSASSMIVPIVDLTESAEGSNIRQDLQTALSKTSTTVITIQNTTSTIINTTGYYRVFGTLSAQANGFAVISITDGTTTKDIYKFTLSSTQFAYEFFDFTVFLEAGDSLTGQTDESGAGSTILQISSRQVADLAGNLVNP